MSESDRIKRIQARVVYADYLIQRDSADKGISRSLNITSGDLVEGIALGPTSFTPVELNSVLVNNNVVIPELIAASGMSVPTRPINLSGLAGDTTVTLTWSVPESNGGLTITNYTIKIYNSVNTLLNSVDVGLSLTDVIRSLINGASYNFTVLASNLYGTSLPSLPITVIPSGSGATVPGVPTIVNITPGNQEITVSWTAPTNTGGSAITGYTVTSNPAGFTRDVSNNITSVTATGLTNGTPYTLTVVARNAIGPSNGSTSSSVTPATVPGVPTIVNITAGNQEVTVSWTAPTNTGGSAITGYTVTSNPAGFTRDVSNNITSVTATGLTNGTPYTLTVVARNAIGPSNGSTSSSVTPATVPGVPTIVNITPGNQEVTVSWTAPTNTGGSAITGYTVTSNPAGFTRDVSNNVTSVTATGLTNGTPYTLTVVARNAIGPSNGSTSSSVTPALKPGVPTGVTGIPADQQVVVSWTAPASNGGSAITGYTVTSDPGLFTATSVGTTATVTGLTNGTPYTFTVVATNAIGDSDPSAASSSITPTTFPGTPNNVALVLQEGPAIYVSWTTSSGLVTRYKVNLYNSNGGFINSSTANSAQRSTVISTGVSPGAVYKVGMQAVNDIPEESIESSLLSITVYDAPSAITNVSGTLGDMQATITWSAPSYNGGTDIVRYTVSVYDVDDNVLSTKDVSGNIRITTISNLTNGTEYRFDVIASNGFLSTKSTGRAVVIPGRIPSTPATPTLITTGYNFIDINWVAPSNGGYTINTYDIKVFNASDIEIPSLGKTVDGVYTSTSMTGLTPNTIYRFSIIAVNSIGPSAQSTKLQATTNSSFSAPSVPQDVSGTIEPGQVTVNWTVPASNGGSAITGYRVAKYDASNNQLSFVDVSNNVFTNTFTSLTGGVLYKFSVGAINAIGTTTSNKISVIALSVPGPVTDAAGTIDGTLITVGWSPPSNNGGSAILNYTVNGNNVGLGQSTLNVVNNPGVYEYSIQAVNAQGPSQAVVVSVTYATAPSGIGLVDPRYSSIEVGNTQIYITWTTPVSPDNGASPITGYTIKLDNSGNITEHDVSGNITSKLITGLTNGTTYQVYIKATNILGSSDYQQYFVQIPNVGNNYDFTPLAVPFPPTNVSTTTPTNGIQVSWTAPTNTGGSQITAYKVAALPEGYDNQSIINYTIFTDASGTTAFVTGLTRNTRYTFKVYATNTQGNSMYSLPSSSVLFPPVAPGAPTNLIGTRGNQEVTVSWTPPTNNGGSEITGYKVNYGEQFIDISGNETNITTVTELTNGQEYIFTVVANNIAGSSVPSAGISVTPATNPGAPTDVSGVSRNSRVIVSWAAPTSTGGSAITGYTVTSDPGSFTATTNGTTATVFGLTNDDGYTFTVVATNDVGDSNPSAASSSITPTAAPGVPDAPTGLSGTFGNQQVELNWTAPASTGDSTITGYTVISNPSVGQPTTTTGATMVTVTGLTNGQTYTFRVFATNTQGDSEPSGPSAPVTPITIPSAPTNVTGVRGGSGQVILSWSAPYNGGSAINFYTVSYRLTSSSEYSSVNTGDNQPTLTVGNLTNGSPYIFTVVAVNSAGNSDASAPSSSVTPGAVPSTMNVLNYENPAASIRAGNTQIYITWSPPANDGGFPITSYTIFRNGTILYDVSGTETTKLITGLTNGATYQIGIRANNILGSGFTSIFRDAANNSNFTPLGVPFPPTNISRSLTANGITVSWTAPTNVGDSAITDYTVLAIPSSGAQISVSSVSTSKEVTGLPKGVTYTFKVYATNTQGNSLYSVASQPLLYPTTKPDVPTNVSASYDEPNTQIIVSWSAPYDGGSAITSYTVTSNRNNVITITEPGVTNAYFTSYTVGLSYTFTITATNAIDTSDPSDATSPVTPTA